jgi:hypothetical protein
MKTETNQIDALIKDFGYSDYKMNRYTLLLIE